MPRLSDLIPPIIYRFLKKKNTAERKVLPEYASFAEAVENGDYHSHKIARVVRLKTERYIRNLEKSLKDKQEIQNLFVVGYIINNIGCSKISFTDIGGACGAYFFLTSRYYQEHILNWRVVETEEMVDEASPSFADGVLIFSKENEISIEDRSVCILQGVLQYFSDPLGYLNEILKMGYKYIYISRLPVTVDQGKSIITLHESRLIDHGPGNLDGVQDESVRIAYTILDKKSLFNCIKESGYNFDIVFQESDKYSLPFKSNDILIENIGFLISKN